MQIRGAILSTPANHPLARNQQEACIFTKAPRVASKSVAREPVTDNLGSTFLSRRESCGRCSDLERASSLGLPLWEAQWQARRPMWLRAFMAHFPVPQRATVSSRAHRML